MSFSAMWLCFWLAGWNGAPWTIEPVMREWARTQAPSDLPELTRLQRLHAALVGRRGLAIAEERGFTADAREAFARRKANCVAFALLFAGLARAVGVEVEFALDAGIREVEMRRDLRVLHGHLAVQWRQGRRRLLIDAQGFFSGSPGEFATIGDATAGAIFYSNRGAELLLDGRLEAARRLLGQSLRWDPRLASARSNLEVVERRFSRRVPAPPPAIATVLAWAALPTPLPTPLPAPAQASAFSGFLAGYGDH